MHYFYKLFDKIIDLMDISVLDLRMNSKTGSINPLFIMKNGTRLDFRVYNKDDEDYGLFTHIQETLLSSCNDPISIEINDFDAIYINKNNL